MNLLTALACHFFGDFPCQPEWIAVRKGHCWETMIYHVLIYTSVFILFGATIQQAAVLLATHFVIDNMKARYHIVKEIWVDQLLHAVVIVLLFY